MEDENLSINSSVDSLNLPPQGCFMIEFRKRVKT